MRHFQRIQCVTLIVAFMCDANLRAEHWTRHTIDASSRGADGVRLGDVNGDGRPDIVTGWEEGGKVRVYVNPGSQRAGDAWPAVTVGNVPSPEDAVFVDLDGDGQTDVVSSCEGKTRSMFVHWAPTDRQRYFDPSAWKTAKIAAVADKQAWMFALPMQIDDRNGIDLIVSAKNAGGQIGWLASPKNPRDMTAWKYAPLYNAGWIMSLVANDVDRDGDLDVIASDRRGENRGILWLENPGAAAARTGQRWKEHRIGGDNVEVMFLDVADLDQDGIDDVVSATRDGQVLFIRRLPGDTIRWHTHSIKNPFAIAHGKAVRVADVNLDGRPDIIHSANTSGNRKTPGVCWMQYANKPSDEAWLAHDISGPDGVKFDLLELIDLDGDGDLDAISCEERDNLGVFWYENPTR